MEPKDAKTLRQTFDPLFLHGLQRHVSLHRTMRLDRKGCAKGGAYLEKGRRALVFLGPAGRKQKKEIGYAY